MPEQPVHRTLANNRPGGHRGNSRTRGTRDAAHGPHTGQFKYDGDPPVTGKLAELLAQLGGGSFTQVRTAGQHGFDGEIRQHRTGNDGC